LPVCRRQAVIVVPISETEARQLHQGVPAKHQGGFPDLIRELGRCIRSERGARGGVQRSLVLRNEVARRVLHYYRKGADGKAKYGSGGWQNAYRWLPERLEPLLPPSAAPRSLFEEDELVPALDTSPEGLRST
jgi:hypothetical protein